jgi:hypothetical protein
MNNPKTTTRARVRLGVSCGVRCGWRLAAKILPSTGSRAKSESERRTEVEGRGPSTQGNPRNNIAIDRHQHHRPRDRWRMSPAATWARRGRRMVAWSCFVLAIFDGAAHSQHVDDNPGLVAAQLDAPPICSARQPSQR